MVRPEGILRNYVCTLTFFSTILLICSVIFIQKHHVTKNSRKLEIRRAPVFIEYETEEDTSIQIFEMESNKERNEQILNRNTASSPQELGNVDVVVSREILNGLAEKPEKNKHKTVPGLEPLVKQIDSIKSQPPKTINGTKSLRVGKAIRYYDRPKAPFIWNGTGETPLLFKGRTFWRDEPITLITQLTVERLKVFKLIAEAWEGPISAVIACKYIGGEPEFSIEKFVKDFPGRTNMILQIYDITGLDMIQYPINKLRNIAWSAAKTPFVFLLDVDFVPSINTHRNLVTNELLDFYFEHANEAPTQKLALVVPAFEAKKTISKINSKDHALELLRRKQIFIWGGRHHAATNFERWKNSSKSYCTQPDLKDEFEPYIVVPWYAPKYDPRFLGYSKNKKSHIVELILAGFDWVVSHNTLVTHMPHPRSKHYQLAGREENAQNWIDFNNEKRIEFPDMISKCSDREWKNIINADFQPYFVQEVRPKEEKKKDDKVLIEELKKQVQDLKQQIENQNTVIENNRLRLDTEKPLPKDVDKEGPFSENQLQPSDELPGSGDEPKLLQGDDFLKSLSKIHVSEKELKAEFFDALQKVFVENLVEKPDKLVESIPDEEYGSEEDFVDEEDPEGEFSGYEEEDNPKTETQGGNGQIPTETTTESKESVKAR